MSPNPRVQVNVKVALWQWHDRALASGLQQNIWKITLWSPVFLLYIEQHNMPALRTFACGSLSFPKKYVFVFYFLFLLQSVQIL